MNQYKAKIIQLMKMNNLMINEDIIKRIKKDITYQEIKMFKDTIYNMSENMDIQFKLIVPDTRNENQIWKDIYKKHFKKISLNDVNSKIGSLILRGYLQFELNYDPKINTEIYNKVTYIFYPQIKKKLITYYDDTINMFGQDNSIPVFKNKWILSKEEWDLYPIVYENFVLTDLHDESLFRSLFQRAKYKKEVKDYLSSLPEDSIISIRIPKYDTDIEIENSMIPNKDLIDLFGFIEDLIYEDLRNEEVYLNNILFHA